MFSGSHAGAPLGVDRLQPGDHAFLAFSDDDERWDLLGVFTRHGFARDEKIYLNVPDGCHPDDLAARVAGGTAAAHSALRSGQLVVSAAPRFSPATFDADQFTARSRQYLHAATAAGFSGIRAANDLSLTLAAFGGLEHVVAFEKALHQALLTPAAGPRYTTLCQWDERWGDDGPVLAALRALHPVTVLSRPGTLRVTWTADGIRLTGDSDLSTRTTLTTALRTLEEPPTLEGSRAGEGSPAPPAPRVPEPREAPDSAERPLVLDIADLSFLDAHSAGAILRLAAGLSPPRRLEIRCRACHRRILHALGGRDIPQLTIVTERLP
jgi:hypothetical protein